MNDQKTWEKALNLFMFALCLGCFLAVEYQQWKLYIDKATGTAVTFEKFDRLHLPFLVFCPKNPSRDGSMHYNAFQSLEALEADAVDVNNVFERLTLYRNSNITDTYRVKEHTYYTMYNGKCSGYHFIDPIPVRMLAKFLLDLTQGPQVLYLLEHPSQILQLIFLDFNPPNAEVQLDTHAIIRLTKVRNSFQDLDERHCSYHLTEADWGQCQIDQMEAYMKRKGFQCVPPQVKDLFPAFRGRVCTDTSDIMNGLLNMSEQLSKHSLGQSELDCEKRCVEEAVKRHKMTFRFTKLPRFPENKTMLLIGYQDGVVETTAEYFIYTPIGILTATGGAMGMFLGWSLFQNYNIFISLFKKIFSIFKP